MIKYIFSLALFQCSVIAPVLHRSAPLFRGVSIVLAVFRCSGGVPLFRCCSVFPWVFRVSVFRWCSVVPVLFCLSVGIPRFGVPVVFRCSTVVPSFRGCSVFHRSVFRCSWFYSMPYYVRKILVMWLYVIFLWHYELRENNHTHLQRCPHNNKLTVWTKKVGKK